MSNIEEIIEKTDVDQVVENDIVEPVENSEDVIGFSQSTENTEYTEEAVQVKTKKKFPLQVPIIIALCLVLATAITYLALSIFIPTIEGSWVLESDGVKTYFTFEQKDGENFVTQSIGTISVSGTFETVKDEAGDTLAISFSSGQGLNCTYSVEGNRLFGECTLTLVDTTGEQKIVLNAVSEPEIGDFIKPYEDFKTNEKLLGEWTLDYGMGTPATLSFGEDGVLMVDWFGTQTETGYYTVADTTVSRKIFYDKEYEDKLEFELTDKGLVFMQQLWTKADTASADQK